MKFFIKLIFVIIVLIIISQLEYKGRKIQTYVEEYFKTFSSKTQPAPVKETVENPAKISEKSTEKTTEKIPTTAPTKTHPDDYIDDNDRKELQNILQD